MTDLRSWMGLALTTALVSACVRAPTVAVVDQKTALERQAAGDYPTLENELQQAGMQPQPEPYARKDLGRGRTSASLGSLAQLVAEVESDAEAIDALLLEQCLGEALNGQLEPRPDECRAGANTGEVARLVGRENLHRRQVWQLIASQQQTSLEQARERWALVHRDQVVCGGLMQQEDTSWKPKACD